MKKRLEADLISIAHRILKLKNRSELIQLHEETQKLYEKLSVLRFVEENLGDVKPTIGLSEMREKLEAAFTTEAVAVTTTDAPKEEDIKEEAVAEVASVAELPEKVNEEPEQAEAAPEEEQIPEVAAETPIIPVQENHTEEENHIPTEEPTQEEEHIQQKEDAPEEYEYEYIHETVVTTPEQPVPEQQEAVDTKEPALQEEVFTPAFELSYETPTEEAPQEVKKTPRQISFEELLGYSYKEPVFEKIGEKISETSVPENAVIPVPDSITDNKTKPVSLNDTLSKTIAIGLNDRIGFEKHLFSGSSEDLNRVLSQLNTFNNLQEATDFITNFVKPDYNNWQGKEEYENRFMELVEKKFA
ncbi:MAG TPA: hypothetical protein VF677_15555 [Flavobacterium sp.]|jgi:hypothetical protein